LRNIPTAGVCLLTEQILHAANSALPNREATNALANSTKIRFWVQLAESAGIECQTEPEIFEELLVATNRICSCKIIEEFLLRILI